MKTVIIDVTSVYHANGMSTAARPTTHNHSCLHARILEQFSNLLLSQCHDFSPAATLKLLEHQRSGLYYYDPARISKILY